MPDDQNTTLAENENIQEGKKNPVSAETTPKDGQDSIPVSPQEPTADVPIPATVSVPAEVLHGDTEASGTGFGVESNNMAPSDSAHIEPEKEPENQASSDAEALANRGNAPSPETVSEPAEEVPELSTESESIQADKETAQISTNEPLKSKLEELPPSVSLPEEKPTASSEPKSQTSVSTETTPPVTSSFDHMRELQIKEQLAIKNKKRKRLDILMTLFLKQSKITNDEVEKFLHISDATATRYLSQLEKEGKIQQIGKTGRGVSYSLI